MSVSSVNVDDNFTVPFKDDSADLSLLNAKAEDL